MYMDENKKPTIGLIDSERFPLINDLSFLSKLKQDECAPIFNFQSGDRLDKLKLDKVNAYASVIRTTKKFWDKGQTPNWVDNYLQWCINTVPLYKNRERVFQNQPTINRNKIRTTPWSFVSSDADLNDLLVYQTSGTTGAAMDVLFDPVSQACWLPQLQSILDLYNIELESACDKVSIALVCSQLTTLTYASLSTYLKGSGILKINLNPNDWKESSHRLEYLEKYNPEILTGDPFAFVDLLVLKPKIKPKALVSSAMKLTDGVRKKLEEYFGCPVIDIYSLTECRMVAVAEGKRHRAIRPELFLEVFHAEQDIPLPYGERGELVITGGNNPFLPLIRYRTGDFCSLEIEDGVPYLVELEARNPVVFFTKTGRFINNIDISRVMTQFSLSGFKMHQNANHDISFVGWSNDDIESSISLELNKLFDQSVSIKVDLFPICNENISKVVNYSSDFSKHNQKME